MKKIYQVRDGYNKIAPYYDTWYWQEFWRKNEKPNIEKWCKFLVPGVGADLGTGSGNNLDVFLQNAHHVDAYDISEKMLSICKEKWRTFIEKSQLTCFEYDIENIFTFERKYDWLLSNRVLSHIKYLLPFIEKLAKIIKYDGACFISDVHPLRHYEYTHYIISDEDVLIETYKHSIDDIKKCFQLNGFEIIKYKEIGVQEAIGTEKIHLDEEPIFYYMILKYRGFNKNNTF